MCQFGGGYGAETTAFQNGGGTIGYPDAKIHTYIHTHIQKHLNLDSYFIQYTKMNLKMARRLKCKN